MKTKKFLASFIVSSSVLFPFAVVSADSNKTDISISNNGDVSLVIPEDADKVLKNTDNQVKYIIGDGATLNNNSEDVSLSSPVVVDTKITDQTDGSTTGVTTYEADLAQAEVIENGNDQSFNLGSIILSQLFGTKVFADNNTYVNKWEKTSTIKFYETIYWKTTASSSVVTKVTGGYQNRGTTASDRQTTVTSSSVEIATSGPNTSGKGLYVQQIKTWNLGTKTSWSISPGYKPIKTPASSTRGGAIYRANIKHGNSKWSLTLSQQVF
ncbi:MULTISPECIES: hypothetical protein [unclassified Lactococcus]|uniref:hypothetical protein n=1 Tax=unclassified Lactococcus TaxID=2643510 RepID=UPI0011C8ED30|nr:MULTISPECIES: hypothetical protein [unclassified Lactococcus]MQW24093.1 hypothetical protein [Lactococcus sp. dk101]TXK36575.1 hypothetical protein FVP42_11135 [Lactococcus sp. dk310]TXK36581.1 hypothetical protein FVP42_11165 [Lactococcus sp. dk310]TXK46410.1 hypothetical protein FVP43_11020 [Lactococcus sp. dk322]TXK46416.1 hypothetical protein FVP43_11050 [Lactococcus sp. dk322]